jgi:probable phosphoglycerate mutase
VTTTFFLVRHGTHDRVDRVLCGRMPGVHLSEAGREQAERVAERLSHEPVAAVRSSPRERAMETAEPVARRLGLPPTPDDAFDELDCGAWTGKTFPELEDHPDWAFWNSARNAARPPHGESMDELTTRCLEGLDRLAAEMPGAGVVIASHAEPLRCIVLDALGLPPSQWWRIRLDPGSVCTITRGEEGSRLIRLNEVPPAGVSR